MRLRRRNSGDAEQAARQAYWGPAVTRFLAAIGKPLPEPMTAEEEAEWDALEDAADEAAAARYGLGYAAAA